MDWKNSHSENGNSLISVMVAAAIASIIILGITTALSNLNNSMAFFRNRVDSIEEQNHLMQLLGDDARCSAALKDVALNLTGVTSAVSTDAKVSLPNLTIALPTGNIVLATLNKPLNPTSGLTVGSIDLKNFLITGANEVQLSIAIGLTSRENIPSIKPMEIRKIVKVASTDPLGAKKILSCGSGGNSSQQCRAVSKSELLSSSKSPVRDTPIGSYGAGPDTSDVRWMCNISQVPDAPDFPVSNVSYSLAFGTINPGGGAGDPYVCLCDCIMYEPTKAIWSCGQIGVDVVLASRNISFSSKKKLSGVP
jgi:hypothetical protein